MRRKRWLVVGVAVAGLLAACGGGEVPAGERGEAAAEHGTNAEHGDHPNEATLTATQMTNAGVEVAVVTARSSSAFVRATGELHTDPDHLAQLGSPISGIVTAARGRVGDRVAAGQVLARVVAPEQRATAAEEPGVRARLELARENQARERALFERGLSPKRDLLAAEAAVREAEAELAVVNRRTEAMAADIATPFSGMIAARLVSIGQAVEAGTPLYTVVAPGALQLILDIYYHDLERIRLGANVAITSATHRDRAETGRVARLSPVIDEVTRTGKVYVEVENRENRFLPGLFVTATIAAAEERREDGHRATSDTVVTIPHDALCRLGDRNVVFIVEEATAEATRFAARDVEVGARLDEEYEIVKGLKPGERIAARGVFSVLSVLRSGELGEGHTD